MEVDITECRVLLSTWGERRFVRTGDHGRCARLATNKGVFPEDGALAKHEWLHFGVGLHLLHGPPFHNVKAVTRLPGFVHGLTRPEGPHSQRVRQFIKLAARQELQMLHFPDRGGGGGAGNNNNNNNDSFHYQNIVCQWMERSGRWLQMNRLVWEVQWNLLDWTPPLNDHLLTFNNLWRTLSFGIQKMISRSVFLRLNTCLRWTIWPIHRGVQCK